MCEKKKSITIYVLILLISLLLLALCACVKPERSVESAALPSEAIIPSPPTDTPGLTIAIEAFTPIPIRTPEPNYTPVLTSAPLSPAPETPPIEQEKYVAAEGISTVAWISDTQHYANTFPEIYPTITSFLFEHKDELNLVYVIHTGDLVHVQSSETNWIRAVEAMALLGDIPYGVLAGNHDEAKKNGIYDNYCKYFGEKFFIGKSWYGESYENNRGHYDLITIGDTEYIFVYMSFEPDENALCFIKNAFDKYPNRVGVLCLHDFIKTDGTLSKDGIIIREKIVATCPNCYLVLCGHRYGFYCLEDSFDDDGDGIADRTVYEMMMNYQAAGKEGGSGYFRLLQFDDEANIIRILSYSAYLNDYNWLDDPGNHEPRYMMDVTSEEFTLNMPWRH